MRFSKSICTSIAGQLVAAVDTQAKRVLLGGVKPSTTRPVLAPGELDGPLALKASARLVGVALLGGLVDRLGLAEHRQRGLVV